jgi:transcriptional regulator with XRE-family HTH domain
MRIRQGFPNVLWNSQESFTQMNGRYTIDLAMRRTSLTSQQALELASILRERRDKLGYSVRTLAARAGVNLATIVRLERGDILTPQPDTLKALAVALELSITDLFAVADWLPGRELPNFRPYLRAKYKDLPDSAVTEMEAFFERLAKKHGVHGPDEGEDEH